MTLPVISALVRLLAGALVLISLVACTAAVIGGGAPGGYEARSGGSSAGPDRKDATITSSINTRYVRDDLINAMDVRVSTDRGIVTLSGRVPSQTTARRAVELAYSVGGVTRVVNRLTVAP
jgi:osmotically-inducible protein OsmY